MDLRHKGFTSGLSEYNRVQQNVGSYRDARYPVSVSPCGQGCGASTRGSGVSYFSGPKFSRAKSAPDRHGEI